MLNPCLTSADLVFSCFCRLFMIKNI